MAEMNLTGGLKGVPKWAWYTSAGVAIAGGAIYVFRNRAAPAAKTSEEDAIVGEGDNTFSSPVPGVIVPNIVTGGGTVPGEQGYAGLHELYMQGIQGLLGSQQDLTDRLVDMNQGLVGTIGGILSPLLQSTINRADMVTNQITGGGAPASAAPPGVVAVAPPVAAPKPACPAGSRMSSHGCCPDKYPLGSAQGCYQVYCAPAGKSRAKGRWHLYGTGREVRVSPTC